jgi:hypothetical protein
MLPTGKKKGTALQVILYTVWLVINHCYSLGFQVSYLYPCRSSIFLLVFGCCFCETL